MEPNYPELQVYMDDAGEWRWRVVAENNEMVCEGAQGHRDSHDAVRAYHDAAATMARIPTAVHQVEGEPRAG